MASKRKICVVVASRANYARVKSLLSAIKAHDQLELQLVVSASAMLFRFGNAVDVIKNDGFTPDATLYTVIEGSTPTAMARSTGIALNDLATTFDILKPDIVLTVADRYETLATAIAASYMNLPLAHTQGGEVTGTIDESVRHAITKLAHIHFPATKKSAERLMKMGERKETIYTVGCPSIDLVAGMAFDKSPTLVGILPGVGPGFDREKPYIIVMQHPVTTEYGQARKQITETLEAIKQLKMQTLWLWPNVDAGSDDISKRLREFREKENGTPIHFCRNFSPETFINILHHSIGIVGNSSCGLRECSYLGLPCVNIGTRQQGREHGKNVIHATYDRKSIATAINKQIKHGRYKSDPIFGDGTAGVQMANILASVKPIIQKQLSY